MDELWYRNVSYEDAIDLAKENLVNSVESFIAAGYWIKQVNDGMEFKKDGYATIWDCAEARLGLKKSEACRAMRMNDKYSVDGNTPFIQEQYRKYNKSQLQEMLTMSEELMEQVSPEMTVTTIRHMKNPVAEVQEQTSQELEGFIHCYVSAEYKYLRRIYSTAGRISIGELRRQARIIRAGTSAFEMVLEDDLCTLVDRETGEIIEKYDSEEIMDVLNNAFLDKCAEKKKKVLPEIRGLLDDPYCGICGAPLAPPDMKYPGMETCSRCGQSVDWSRWPEIENDPAEKYVATSQQPVNTQENEELQEDFITAIETDPEQEEINVEFSTDELFDELDVIDADYREVSEELSSYGPATFQDSSLTKPDSGQEKEQPAAVEQGGMEPEGEGCADSESVNETEKIREILQKEQRLLSEYTSLGDIPENTVYRQKIIVGALANMLCDLENMQQKDGQPELPILENDSQRKEWLNNYKEWGLWYRDENIDVNYYKFDFEDGSRIVVSEFPQRQQGFSINRRDIHCYNMIVKNRENFRGKKFNDQYCPDKDLELYLVEFLRDLQKKKRSVT